MNTFFLSFLVFVPIAAIAAYVHAAPVAVFFLSALAIIPLAKLIGDATEKLSARTSPALGGLLNATFGNATELIIGAFAIKAGLLEVVKASLRANAAAVIFAHNHPSGVAQPSQADECLTRNLKEALALVDVKVLDHFIVAGTQALSFAERGLL